MFRKAVLFLFATLLFQGASGAEKVWQAQNSGISDTDIRSVSVFGADEDLVCAAGADTVYLSQNSGAFWQEIFSLAPEDTQINFVAFGQSDPKEIFLATSEGLYATKNQGQDWRRIFSKVSAEAKNVGWIAFDPLDSQKVYIGTGEGLYFSQDKGETWRKSSAGLPRSQVRAVVVHPFNSRVLYLANTYGLFKSIDAAESWERIYVTSHSLGDDEDEGDEENSSEADEDSNLINCIVIDRANTKEIFLATGEGVVASCDTGETWDKLPAQGLTCDYVNFIVASENKNNSLYAATQGGVFKFSHNSNSWQEIYQGMSAREVRSLALDAQKNELFAGTDRGVFKTVEIKTVRKQVKEEKVAIDKKKEIDFEQALQEIYLNEPAIQEVQEAALRYARVIHPQQIQQLRRDAKLKALLPDVSLDFDKTIYGSTTREFVYAGPRDWGLSFSWDIGDLVYSEQVRLIDSNTRLMVQLRDDILDEVTRFYYERRKLQAEVILTPPDGSEQTFTRRLRLEELTANIDALTGGWFSRHLKKQVKLSLD